jgi:hypothetical protein
MTNPFLLQIAGQRAGLNTWAQPLATARYRPAGTSGSVLVVEVRAAVVPWALVRDLRDSQHVQAKLQVLHHFWLSGREALRIDKTGRTRACAAGATG